MKSAVRSTSHGISASPSGAAKNRKANGNSRIRIHATPNTSSTDAGISATTARCEGAETPPSSAASQTSPSSDDHEQSRPERSRLRGREPGSLPPHQPQRDRDNQETMLERRRAPNMDHGQRRLPEDDQHEHEAQRNAYHRQCRTDRRPMRYHGAHRRFRDHDDAIAGCIAYPRFRTMDGPMALTTLRGNRCHKAIMARYLGLAGLFCGISARLSSLYS